MRIEPISFAELSWSDGGVPLSDTFDDVYYSREGGLEETRHVFINGNNLKERFKEDRCFTIVETGFGTGLNFLTLREMFLSEASANARIEFFTCEKYPLKPADMERALAFFPEVSSGTHYLLENYGPFIPGFRRILFDSGRIALNLFLGDVSDFLNALEGPVDAWFLDGFSPAKNNQMWNSDLYNHMGRISREKATAATFTVAGDVRRGLESAGFTWQKTPGYGGKKQMLQATKTGVCPGCEKRRKTHLLENPLLYQPEAVLRRGDRAIVIGGGIAGTSAAWSLARRGIFVTLVEREKRIASRASGNPAGIIFPFLNALPTPMSRYIIQCFQFILHRVREMEKEGLEVKLNRCGVLQMAHEERQAKRFISAMENLGYPDDIVRAVDTEEASEIAGTRVNGNGVFFPSGLWIHPPHISSGNVRQSGDNISVLTESEAVSFFKEGDTWFVKNKQDEIITDGKALVFAAGAGTRDISVLSDLPVKLTRGQIALVPETEKSRQLKAVVCYDGYVIPSVDGKHVVGASYERNRLELTFDAEVNKELLNMLENWVPGLLVNNEDSPEGRVDFRVISLDHMPLIGALADDEAILRFLDGNSGEESLHKRGLFITAGHGSRGMNYAPLGGEIIAALAMGETPPVEKDILQALAPSRYMIRQWKRMSHKQ